jgi:hypothetical protein
VSSDPLIMSNADAVAQLIANGKLDREPPDEVAAAIVDLLSRGTPALTVDALADVIEVLDQQGKRYEEIAAAVLEMLPVRAEQDEQDDTDSNDRFQVAVTRAAATAAVLGALALLTGWVLAVAAVWATTLHDQLASTAMLSAFGGAVLLVGAAVVIASSDAS